MMAINLLRTVALVYCLVRVAHAEPWTVTALLIYLIASGEALRFDMYRERAAVRKALLAIRDTIVEQLANIQTVMKRAS
jgi:hypothetical protein